MADREAIRVVTCNVRYGMAADGPNHWEARKGILLDAVRDLHPDVMGVQECHSYQADWIKMGMPHMDRVGVGRYHETVVEARPQESLSGEHCDVWFDTRRFLVRSCGTFWHSDTPEKCGSASWGNPYPRITTWAVLAPRARGRSFAFFSTHFHGGEPYASLTADLHAQRIPRHAGALPSVLVGDFNHGPESALHGRLTGAGSLRDVWQALGMEESGAGTCHDFDGKPKNRIDWILVGNGWKPLSMERSLFQRGGRFPSDHFPLVAELVLEQGP